MTKFLGGRLYGVGVSGYQGHIKKPFDNFLGGFKSNFLFDLYGDPKT